MSTPRLIRLSPQSPSPDPALRQYGLIADAIYEYCRSQLNTEDIILQHHLLEPDIIPGKSPDILLAVCQHLVDNHLFKIHELRDGSIGWKVVSRESAQKYTATIRVEQAYTDFLLAVMKDSIKMRHLSTQ